MNDEQAVEDYQRASEEMQERDAQEAWRLLYDAAVYALSKFGDDYPGRLEPLREAVERVEALGMANAQPGEKT